MKNAILTMAILIGLTALARPEHVPSDAQKFGDHYYKVMTVTEMARSGWFSASYTKAVQLKGKLASVTSEEENTFVLSLIGGQDAWIGIMKEGDKWVASENRQVATYENWSDDKKSGAHVYIRGDGKWSAVKSKKVEIKRFVCKWKDEE